MFDKLCNGMLRMSIVTIALAFAPVQTSQAQTREYNVAAQSATTGIPAFARQAGIQILVSEPLVRGKQVAAVTGWHSVADALVILLEGTGLVATSMDSTTYTLAPSRLTSLHSETGATSAAAPGPELIELEEVIVTAQKRQQNIRDVPISISVIGQKQIADQRIRDVSDITRAVPNFSFSTAGGPGSNTLEIRGVSSSAGASTVGTYLDDLALTSLGGQPEPVLFDVQQIEVLRGPQGTLYGASAAGGLIKFRLNPVDLDEFEAIATADASNTQHGSRNYGGTAVVNVPLKSGVVGARLGVASRYDSGYVDRYSPTSGALVSPRVNDRRTNAARLAFDIQPTDALSIVPSIFYQRISYGSTDVLTLGLGGLATNNLVTDFGRDTMVVPSLTVHYDFGWAELTSVTANFTRSTPLTYDGTEYNSAVTGYILDASDIRDLQGNLSGDVIAALPSPARNTAFERHITQEVRLSSRPAETSRLDWTVGFYYEKVKGRYSDAEPITNFNEVFTSLYGADTLDAFFGGPLPDDMTWFARTHTEMSQYSAFGDVTFHVTPALRLSAGARVLHAKHANDSDGYGFYYTFPPQAASSNDDAVTPRVSATYAVSKDVSLYATVSQGFRLGGPNYSVSSELCADDLAELGLTEAPSSYGHDKLWNYEVGVKARPSSRFVMDGAVYYIEWDQLQQGFYLPSCGLSFTENVGSARSYGAEVSFTYRPIPALTLSAAGGYTNAELTESIAFAGVRAGERIEGVPDYSASASAEYRQRVNADAVAFFRGNYSYVGESHGTLNPSDPDYLRRSYGVAGASVGVTFDQWDVSLYANNLFDNDEIIQRPNRASVPTGFTLRPRTVGISVAATF